jgi:uncharacterized protein YeaO (DUF488 family)
MFMYEILLKRVYDPVSESDGFRILVDRLWPRGISKERAALADWAKDLAPSTALRKDFCHLPERMEAFRVRYTMELDQSEGAAAYAEKIQQILEIKPVTLLYGAKDPEINHAVVLKAWLDSQMAAK